MFPFVTNHHEWVTLVYREINEAESWQSIFFDPKLRYFQILENMNGANHTVSVRNKNVAISLQLASHPLSRVRGDEGESFIKDMQEETDELN